MNINDNNFEIEDEEIKEIIESEGESETVKNMYKYISSFELMAKELGIWEEVKKEREKALEEFNSEDMSDLSDEDIECKFLSAKYGTIIRAIKNQPRYEITNLAQTIKLKQALKLINEAVLNDYNIDMNENVLSVKEKKLNLIGETSSMIQVEAKLVISLKGDDLQKFLEACKLADTIKWNLSYEGNICFNLHFRNTENVYFEKPNKEPEK